jgi:gluconokinase
MTFNYILTKDLFISGGPINNGGVVLKWYIEVFLQKKLSSPGDFDAFLDEMKNHKARRRRFNFYALFTG